MKAMVIKSFGKPEVFEIAEIPKPKLQSGHVLIRVKASTVNPIDCKIRSGLLKSLAPETGVLGFDVAGIIEEIGDGVSKFSAGEEVFGCSGAVKEHSGALAEYQLVDANLLAKRPANLSLDECVALPLVSITAWDALIRGANIKEGECILVHGGAGGVGHLGIQLAKMKGAEVFSTVSSDKKAEIVKGYGATPINYHDLSVAQYVDQHTEKNGFDVVFDTVGGDNLMRSLEASKIEGRVTSVNTRTTCDLSILHQKALSLHVVFMIIPILYNQDEGKVRQGEILNEIVRGVELEAITPLINKEIFPFERVAEAHSLLESGKATGKIILKGFDAN
ncbi:MAG TPA: quinone oxidoreductase [Verrucomicrobia bacterium]|nr:quinone oxidoreductase [Verrucomicrobiales bacterium]HIL53675.1 quinone oxidoreductase [Verrucomicrobiota bacterium]